MALLTGHRLARPVLVRPADAVKLHDVPFELVPREVPFFLCETPAGFPSPAQDDMQEPIDLGAWLVEHPCCQLHHASGWALHGRRRHQ